MTRLTNIIVIALKSILKNKRRNIFTMIGIIIGIAAVITIMSLGNGFKETTTKEFEDTGAAQNIATISFMTDDGEDTKENPFKQEDLSLVKQIEGVLEAKLKVDEDESYTAKMTNPQHMNEINIKKRELVLHPEKGQGFSKEDNDLFKKVVIISKDIAKNVFKHQAIGKTIFIENQGFEVVGIENDPMDDALIQMPSQTFNRYMVNLNQGMHTLQLTVTDGSSKKEIANQVVKQLNKKGSGNGNGSYSYNDTEAMLKGIGKVFDAITYFVAAVAGISLFIAGIGVMNVMYISVSERTEEIAIRRAFGAKARDIELQFLIESVVLCVLGGLIGLTLGIIFASLIDLLTPKYITSVVSFSSILISVGVSTLIGVVFGWVPARAAAKKELIDIIK